MAKMVLGKKNTDFPLQLLTMGWLEESELMNYSSALNRKLILCHHGNLMMFMTIMMMKILIATLMLIMIMMIMLMLMMLRMLMMLLPLMMMLMILMTKIVTK